MEPFLTGGEMISSVSLERTTWNEIPWKFEAGTPAIAECIGLGAAVDYLQSVGMEAIEAHEQLLTRYGHDLLRSIPGVTVFGPPPERRAGILTFNVCDIHPHDVAQVLDADAICVRAGHHCAQPVVDHYGVAATTRASVYLYNTTADLDRLADGIERVKHTFGV
jgi:cysteine desulfurase/selenocysteine lyase